MIAVPRVGDLDPVAVAPDAGVHREVALAQPRAVVVAPEGDRHRRHRLGQDELADLAHERVAVLVEGLDLGAQRARLQLALVDRQRRARRRRTRCTGRSRRWWRTATCPSRRARRPSRSPPATAATRSSRRRAARRGRARRAGSTSAFMHERDVGGARPEGGHPGALGQVPQRAEVGRAGIAVEEHDRGRRQQHADEEVPHHPAGRGEPEDAIALLRVEVQVHVLEVLEQDPALAVDDRLGQPGRARAVEQPQRMVERDRSKTSGSSSRDEAPRASRCRRGSRSAPTSAPISSAMPATTSLRSWSRPP